MLPSELLYVASLELPGASLLDAGGPPGLDRHVLFQMLCDAGCGASQPWVTDVGVMKPGSDAALLPSELEISLLK